MAHQHRYYDVSASHLWHTMRIALAATIIYGVAALLWSPLLLHSDPISIWTPSGVGLVLALLWGSAAIPGVTLGAFISGLIINYSPDSDWPLLAAYGLFSIGVGLQAHLGATGLRRYAQHGLHPFGGVRDVALLVIIAALGCGVINATTGLILDRVKHVIMPHNVLSHWATLWLADAACILVIAPFLLIWRRLPRFGRRLWLEFVALNVLIVGCWIVMLVLDYPAEYFLIPLLILSVFRFGVHGGSGIMLTITAVSLVGVRYGKSSFIHDDWVVTLMFLQIFLVVVSITWLVIGAVIKEREIARHALSHYSQDLESRIRRRTLELEAANAALSAEIEAQQQVRQALIEAKLTAEAANEAKTTFLATMSHELRTPIHAIVGFTELQLEGIAGELTPKQREYQQRVLVNARDLLAIISDVLDLSRIEAREINLRSVAFNIRDWLTGVVDQFAIIAQQKGLVIKKAVDHRVPVLIECDPVRLRQVLANLLSNAVKFTETGSITIFIYRATEATLHIQVADTGIGIPPEQLERIFDSFYQVDGSPTRQHGGSGLGLAIVRQTIDSMGGKVSVISERGTGSTFTLEIPLTMS